jgi:signal transduction histidine kinase
VGETTNSGLGFAATLVGFFGVLVTVIVVATATSMARSAAEADLALAGRDAAHGVEQLTEAASFRLTATSGLFRASDQVTAEEFTRFVEDVGFVSGMDGVGYVEVVSRADLGDSPVWASLAGRSRVPFSLDELAQPSELRHSDSYEIILYAEPVDTFGEMIGFDLGSFEPTLQAMRMASLTRRVQATTLLAPSDLFDGDEFFIVEPVARSDGSIRGFGIALLDLSSMAESLGSITSLDGREITMAAITPGSGLSPASWSTVVTAFGRQWQLGLAPQGDSSPWSPGRIALGLFGLILTLGAVMLTEAGAETRRTRSEMAQMVETNRQTDRLLSMVSHELRTPLTIVVGFLDELCGGWKQFDEDELESMLVAANTAALDVADLVSDLLVRERIVAQTHLVTNSVPVDGFVAVERVIRRFAASVDLALVGPTSLPVLADPLRLRQIMRNLLDNAVKHGGSPITLSFESFGEFGRIRVSDGGPGVSACCLPGLFELDKETVEHGHPGRPDSHGFGLPISRFLATAMGGDLTYDATRGFELNLPLAEPTTVLAGIHPSQAA